jgi:hypothetical protein
VDLADPWQFQEWTEYYTRAQSRARSDAIRRTTLLAIKHNNSDGRHSEPILPLVSDKPDAFRKSPLYRFLRPGEDESEVASSFMGPGPWTIDCQLRVPDSCSILHPSNRTKGSNVMVNHTLKLVLRVEKEEGTVTTRKSYDIVIHIPIQILSVSFTCPQHTSRIHPPLSYSAAARWNGRLFHATTRWCGRRVTPRKSHRCVRVVLATKRKREHIPMQSTHYCSLGAHFRRTRSPATPICMND